MDIIFKKTNKSIFLNDLYFIHFNIFYIAVFQSLSCVQLFATAWTAACWSSVLHYLMEFVEIHASWVGDAI